MDEGTGTQGWADRVGDVVDISADLLSTLDQETESLTPTPTPKVSLPIRGTSKTLLKMALDEEEEMDLMATSPPRPRCSTSRKWRENKKFLQSLDTSRKVTNHDVGRVARTQRRRRNSLRLNTHGGGGDLGPKVVSFHGIDSGAEDSGAVERRPLSDEVLVLSSGLPSSSEVLNEALRVYRETKQLYQTDASCVTEPRGVSFTSSSRLGGRNFFEYRKRLTDLSRDHDRSQKWDERLDEFDASSPPTREAFVGSEKSTATSKTTTAVTPHSQSLSIAAPSLPPAPIKVETTNCFTSLASKPVLTEPKSHRRSSSGITSNTVHENSTGSLGNSNSPGGRASGLQTPVKRSSVTGSERYTFHKLFLAMVKSSHLNTSVLDSSKEENSDKRLRSEDSVDGSSKALEERKLYQNTMGDVIWLELQAWFAGRSVEEQDEYITDIRRTDVRDVIRDVINFKFRTEQENVLFHSLSSSMSREVSQLSLASDRSHINLDASASSDVFYDAQESMSEGALSRSTSSVNTLLAALEEEPLMKKGKELRNCINVFDTERLAIVNEALEQVSTLLQRLDAAEQMYASWKMFGMDHPTVNSSIFQTRVKCLCLWYNVTMQMRTKIAVVGDVLQVGRHSCRQWPKFGEDDEYSTRPNESVINTANSEVSFGKQSSVLSSHSREPSGNIDVLIDNEPGNNESKANTATSKVTFKLSEGDAERTLPSESNSSTDSGVPTTNSGGSTSPAVVLTTAPNTGNCNSHAKSKERNLFDEELSRARKASKQGLNTDPYYRYVEKFLKTKGLRKTLATIQRFVRGPTRRARLALERPAQRTIASQSNDASKISLDEGNKDVVKTNPIGTNVGSNVNMESVGSRLSEMVTELGTFGVWNDEFQKMDLPSFRAPYLFLCRVPLDIVHECLKIRLQQKPIEPSELSIRQLMRECKEIIRFAVTEKQKYIGRVNAAILDLEDDKSFIEAYEHDLAEFDDNLYTTLEVYLGYLQSFVTMIQCDTSWITSTYQKNLLEEEWLFIKQTCPQIKRGESIAGNAFCEMACGMLKAIGDFLNTEIDEVVRRMFVFPDSSESDDDAVVKHQVYEACRGFQTVFSEAKERAFKALAFSKTLRKDLEVSAEFRLKKAMKKSDSTSSMTDEQLSSVLIERLKSSGHVRLVAPHSSDYLIFVSGNIREKQEHILQLLDMHVGAKEDSNPGYLLLLKCGDEQGCQWEGDSIYVKPTAETTIALAQMEISAYLEPDKPCQDTVTFSMGDNELLVTPPPHSKSFDHLQSPWTRAHGSTEGVGRKPFLVEGVLLVSPRAGMLNAQAKQFASTMRDILVVKHEQRATSHKIASSLQHVKNEALHLREKITRELSMIEEKCDVTGMGDLDPADIESLCRRTREILFQCYKFGFEYHKELDRLVTGPVGRRALSLGMIEFSCQWTRFVLGRCERGRGIKPRWAHHGIEFLCIASLPSNTRHLTEEQFNEFKETAKRCYEHVIGDHTQTSGYSSSSNSNTLTRSSRSRSRSRPSSPSRANKEQTRAKFDSESFSTDVSPSVSTQAFERLNLNSSLRGKKKMSTAEEPETPDISFKVPAYARTWSQIHNSGHLPWSERVAKSVAALESDRDNRRRHEGNIGTVWSYCRAEDRIHIKSKMVNFSWQRGVKIGQGHFGKVYTAVNNATGDIMAMKEIPLQPNDHKTLRNVADELRIFENIHHKHLINHYGVEVHREEMLIFMEYCPEGTLEDLVTTTEGGLEEQDIRSYSRQLVQAVAVLHEHGVVHRDIKGANIFLTDEMRNLKLGDFGCAVQIKAHTTMPGELQGFVGTQAYMAPEVFTKNLSEGYGRAADIWSVGCVVVEMATGKRPWYELESNYQIMFKVGMGKHPEIPEKLSNEGQDFLQQCFLHDPMERSSADDLLNEPFLKVFEEEETQSLPMFASLADMPGFGSKFQLIRKASNN